MADKKLTLSEVLEEKANKDAAANKYAETKRRFADEFEGVSVGDTVVVTGFSHRGKKMNVEHVALVEDWFGSLRIKATGRVIKKDGSVGSMRAESFYGVSDND